MTTANEKEPSKFGDVLDAVKRGEEGSKIKFAQLIFSRLGVNEEMIQSLEEQAKNGDSEAMWKLGLCKEYGIKTKQNRKEAEYLYEASSEGGNPTGVILSLSAKDDKKEEECEEDCGEEGDDDGNDEEYEDDYDDSYDDYADEVLDRMGWINAAKAGSGWVHPTKRVNYSKSKFR